MQAPLNQYPSMNQMPNPPGLPGTGSNGTGPPNANGPNLPHEPPPGYAWVGGGYRRVPSEDGDGGDGEGGNGSGGGSDGDGGGDGGSIDNDQLLINAMRTPNDAELKRLDVKVGEVTTLSKLDPSDTLKF